MTNEQKNECFTALVATAFTHYKKIIQGDPMETHLPPTPSESKAAYLNDPILRKCVDGVLYGALAIYDHEA